jgi:DNA-binding transcriptional LysR family regulator
MEFRRLRYFLRIAAEGSLGKASRALGIAQPALGRQIQLLEAELGVRLFQRVAKGMLLTDEGEYLKEALEHPLQLVDIALQNVRSYSARVEAALILGLPPVIAQFMGARLLQRLRTDMPNLKLRIAEGDSTRLAEDISRGLVDIALLIDVTPDRRAFHAEILTEPLMLVGPPGTLPAHRNPMAFKELEGLPLVLPGPQSSLRTRLTKVAAGLDATIRVVLEIDSACLAKQAVRTGAGLTILAPATFKPEAERGELAGVPISGLEQSVLWAVQPHWRVRRSTYNEVERVIYEELYAAVSSGEWPADWKLDLARLSSPLRLNRAGERPAVPQS